MSSKKYILRVQSGSLKGVPIEFPINQYQNTGVTQQKLKKNLFNLIQSLIKKKSEFDDSGFGEYADWWFVDLFAGSGQIGIEALSMGFHTVYFNELDFGKFKNLQGVLSGIREKYSRQINQNSYLIDKKNGLFLLNRPQSLFNKLKLMQKYKGGILFCDPPFIKIDKNKESKGFWQRFGASIDSFISYGYALKVDDIKDSLNQHIFIIAHLPIVINLESLIDKSSIKNDIISSPIINREYGGHRLIIWQVKYTLKIESSTV